MKNVNTVKTINGMTATEILKTADVQEMQNGSLGVYSNGSFWGACDWGLYEYGTDFETRQYAEMNKDDFRTYNKMYFEAVINN